MDSYDNATEALDWASTFLGIFHAEPIAMTAFSKVWRLRNASGTFYLKHAIGSLFSEPAMCQLIAKAAGPGLCPEVVASSPELSCFLTRSLGTLTLREKFERDGFDVLLLRKAYETLIEIQRALAPRVDECLACGSTDWRGARLAQAFDDMLLSPGFSAHGMTPDELGRARVGSAILRRATDALDAIAPGSVWSDDDFNDKNVALDGACLGILDLGETSFAPPLLGLRSSLGGFLQRLSLREGSAEALLLRDACLEQLGVEGSYRDLAWDACSDALPAYGALCLHRLTLNSGPSLLLDPRYAHRMRDTLAKLNAA